MEMNIKYLFVGILFVTLVSCGPSKEEFDSAAETLCDCMSEKSTERTGSVPTIYDNSEYDTASDYSFCMLRILFTDVEPDDEGLSKSMGDVCPELQQVHDDYAVRYNE